MFNLIDKDNNLEFNMSCSILSTVKSIVNCRESYNFTWWIETGVSNDLSWRDMATEFIYE